MTSPPKQNLEISSSNSNATLAKSGDTINVTIDCKIMDSKKSPIQSASSTIFARTANVVNIWQYWELKLLHHHN